MERPEEATPGDRKDPVGTGAIREVGGWFASAGAVPPTAPQAAPSTARPPRVIADRYEIVDVLGRGGMGIVYLARDRQLGRDVAVKLLQRGDLFDPEDVARFRLEAVATASLRHPHIVPVHDLGEHEGLPFYTMDVIEGENLASIAARGGVEPRLAAEIGRQVAGALEAGHAAGILHRDIKPQNILVRIGGAQPHAWLADFGLAKLVDRRVAEAASPHRSVMSLTRSGELLGTPAYMSPEQVDADGRIDARSDLYSLGATLYVTLTAELPFKAATLTALLAAVREQDPVPPRSLNPEIDRDLETIVLKLLQKDPRHRYECAGDLREEFRRYLAGEPILARPVGPVERLWRRARRRPAVAVPIALLLAVVLGGLGTIAWRDVKRRSDLAAACSGAWGAHVAGRHDEAIWLAQEARRLAPDDAEAVALEGRMRGEKAAKDGDAAYARYRDARARIAAAEAERQAIDEDASHTPEKGKRAWELARLLREAGHDRERGFEQAAARFAEALAHWPQHPLARERLGDLYWDCYVEAENEGDLGDMQAYATLVRQHAPEKYARELVGKADVRIELTVPSGARPEFYLFRYELRDIPPLMVPIPWAPRTGATRGAAFDSADPFRLEACAANRIEPLADRGTLRWSARLPFGSYLLWVPSRGWVAETRYPFVVMRDETWQGCLELGLLEDLPRGEWAYVPEGYFQPEADSDTAVEMDGFLIARCEVTCAEYAEFLNDPEARKGGLVPEDPPLGPQEGIWKREGERYRIPDGAADLPVTGLDFRDAAGYAEWRTQRDGRGEWTFRLPTVDEWEMAARGADGRDYPWGLEFAEGFCAAGNAIEPAGKRATDESPYGVRGMAGGVAEWTSTQAEADHERRVVKGGGWRLPAPACLASFSLERRVDDRDPAVGFRLIAIPTQ